MLKRLLSARRSLPAAHWNDEGIRRWQANELVAARDAFRKALKADPSHAGAASNLGALLLDDGREDEALALLAHAVDLAPGEAAARVNLANGLVQTSRLAEGVEHFREALRLDPGHALARRQLLRPLLDLCEWEAARCRDRAARRRVAARAGRPRRRARGAVHFALPRRARTRSGSRSRAGTPRAWPPRLRRTRSSWPRRIRAAADSAWATSRPTSRTTPPPTSPRGCSSSTTAAASSCTPIRSAPTTGASIAGGPPPRSSISPTCAASPRTRSRRGSRATASRSSST